MNRKILTLCLAGMLICLCSCQSTANQNTPANSSSSAAASVSAIETASHLEIPVTALRKTVRELEQAPYFSGVDLSDMLGKTAPDTFYHRDGYLLFSTLRLKLGDNLELAFVGNSEDIKQMRLQEFRIKNLETYPFGSHVVNFSQNRPVSDLVADGVFDYKYYGPTNDEGYIETIGVFTFDLRSGEAWTDYAHAAVAEYQSNEEGNVLWFHDDLGVSNFWRCLDSVAEYCEGEQQSTGDYIYNILHNGSEVIEDILEQDGDFYTGRLRDMDAGMIYETELLLEGGCIDVYGVYEDVYEGYDDVGYSEDPSQLVPDNSIAYFRFQSEVGKYVVKNGEYVRTEIWSWTNNTVKQYSSTGAPMDTTSDPNLPPVQQNMSLFLPYSFAAVNCPYTACSPDILQMPLNQAMFSTTGN